MKSFAEGVAELKRIVGDGKLEGLISVNQVYAHWIDTGFTFKHPRGGEAGFLSLQMVERRDEVLQVWANSVLSGGVIPETVRLLTSFSDQVFIRSPREFEILRNSTSLKLFDHRALTFVRPAMVPRLSDAQLKAIRAMAGGNVTRSLRSMRGMK